jgi:ATP-dependent protease ClpP protease subunit
MGRNYHTNHVIEEAHDYGINYEKREIFLHSHIMDCDDEPGTDYRMSNAFFKNIRLLDDNSGKNIVIYQNNIGGEWHHGMSIYDSILSCANYVLMVGHGTISSMGAVVMQASDKRLLMPNCEFMVHSGGENISGFTYTQAQSSMEWSRKLHTDMINIFAGRCVVGKAFANKTRNQIKNTLRNKLRSKEDWIMSPSEALEFGFIDGIIGEHYDLNELHKCTMS